MPNKTTILRFLAVLVLFAAVDAWVYFTLRGTLRSQEARDSESRLTLLARSVPADPENLESWLTSVPESLPGGAAVYLVPTEDPEVYETRTTDEEAALLWDSVSGGEDAADRKSVV